jgi:hypothetical protein
LGLRDRSPSGKPAAAILKFVVHYTTDWGKCKRKNEEKRGDLRTLKEFEEKYSWIWF